jgi:aminocarboxymuconate-semialdehyde decarboxylase
MITDIHCHLVPDDFFQFVRTRPEYDLKVLQEHGDRIDTTIRGMFFGLNRTFFDVDRQLARMDGLGVERSILSLATPFVNYYLEESDAVHAARICNDGLAEAVRSAPRRFGAWAYLPMQSPVQAAIELERCVREHGFVGGHVGTNVKGVYLSDEMFAPLFDKAQALKVPLFIHPADPAGKDRTQDYELTVVAGYPFDSTINILRMICSGFLDRYPDLKLLCAHTGAFSLMLRARMQREVDTNPELARRLKRSVGEYLEALYYDSICMEPGYLNFAASIVPISHILLGSDGPFPLGEADPVGFVRRSLSEADAALVMERNVERLFAPGAKGT